MLLSCVGVPVIVMNSIIMIMIKQCSWAAMGVPRATSALRVVEPCTAAGGVLRRGDQRSARHLPTARPKHPRARTPRRLNGPRDAQAACRHGTRIDVETRCACVCAWLPVRSAASESASLRAASSGEPDVQGLAAFARCRVVTERAGCTTDDGMCTPRRATTSLSLLGAASCLGLL